MPVTYKMKFILVWLYIISEAYTFPTQPPPDVENRKPCCAGQPQVSDKYVEYTTMKNGLKGEENSLTNSGDGEQYKDVITETNTPSNTYGNNKMSDMQSNLINETSEDTQKMILSTFSEKPTISTQNTIHMPDLNSDTINGQVTVVQNDAAIYEDSVVGSNVTEGSQEETTHNRDVERTNGHSNIDSYYNKEGSILIDIPAYNDSDADIQDPNIDFPSKDDELNSTLGCTDGLCGNSSIYIENPLTQLTTRNTFLYSNGNKPGTDGYAAGEENTVKPTSTWSAKATKTVSTNKNKSNKKPEKSHMNKKEPLKMCNTGRNVKYNSGHRQRFVKHGGSRHHSKSHRHSSSESTSDSSQEFD
ncbi:uncharacterized protein LOC142143819 isoform X2 [Mixophyes fleayi]|uniref:uncharacterized protein LOC142143819 isoform X2 n=1 Tax=Mixophyes fleayi TaxID=3061075 RepID=UPI003F4D902B